MYNVCCVENCESRRDDMDANFYRLPKSEKGLYKWLQSLNSDFLRSLRVEQLKKLFVCRKHFEKKYFTSSTLRSRLRADAYPTLFSETEILSGIPMHNVQRSINARHVKKRRHEDHSYCKPEVVEKRSRSETDVGSLPSTSHILNDGIKSPIEKGVVLRVIPKQFKRTNNLVSTLKPLMPKCAKLYREYLKSLKQSDFSIRARRAMKFSKERAFQKITANMNPLAKKMMWMQIKLSTKKAKGRRFTNDEKLLALSIMKQSPKCYSYLHKIFILPSKRTLNKMIAEFDIEAGINPQIFEAMRQEVNTWEIKKKYCSIIFDEISLESALTYDKHKDLIDGFVHLNEKTSDLADHAFVFMLRGAIFKWQQPIAFYFCKGATSGLQLKRIIKDIIAAVSNVGLLPVALVSDQGTAFQSALKSLQEDTRREQIRSGEKIDDVISINGHSLSVIYDPPHLIKGLRNNFITKNIKFENKISKWSDIVEVYKTDCNHAQMRLLYKLNDEHVIPEKIKKMKVKNCTQVFSKTVASTLSYTAQFSQYSDGSKTSSTLKNTADIVSFFDDLFDSVNGTSVNNKNCKGKPLRQAVTEKSCHHTFWSKSIVKLQNIKFVDNKGKETTVPSIKNWVTTLKSYQRLWHYFQNNNIIIMRPRYFNSDPIENFFGQVRAYNFRNNDPDCHTFKATFRSLLITRFIKFHSSTFNCQEDSGDQLLKLQALFATKDLLPNDISDKLESLVQHPDSVTSQFSVINERQHVHSRAYTTGWVIRKLLCKMKCQLCEDSLTSREVNIEKNCLHNWISYKEFKSNKTKKLTYPSEYAVRIFGSITEETNKYLENQPHQKDLIQRIKMCIRSKYLFEFLSCDVHKNIIEEYFLDYTVKLTVFNWCNTINKILKGTDVARLKNKSLPAMQLKAFTKYKTKLRNRRIRK